MIADDSGSLRSGKVIPYLTEKSLSSTGESYETAATLTPLLRMSDECFDNSTSCLMQ